LSRYFNSNRIYRVTALTYIESHLFENLKLETLAKASGISLSSLQKKLSQRIWIFARGIHPHQTIGRGEVSFRAGAIYRSGGE
jgi:hypothetical protein